ncbi:hypothetical protein MesoLjLc_50860 [Mesorhizobium sp. L-8-10]|uniref:hypothetical protein n=1 Tax=Mesorhizobium sp. L-8-10 TaxID=2744523 RepID=UPI0019286AAD|nr:hypothetical protein [Mesorhizobium sp. L-8-10]BCH33156.1 hypothetical protein MesoLjLc_50860 [Mesorhizobium sp. L-8-10]
MADHIAIIGLKFADQSIPWPERGSAETVLCDRPGWERHTIPVVSRGPETSVEAMCRGELAVHLMLGGDEGFAISLANGGWRISYGGSVFARCADAMAAAEAMMEASSDWSACPKVGFSAAQCEALRAIIEKAERRGEIMLDRVYPS